MAKRLCTFIAVLLLASVMIFAGCSSSVTPVDTKTEFQPSAITDILKEFVTANPDRTSFSGKEKEAADYLEQKLSDLGVTVQERQKFSYEYTYGESAFSPPSIQHTFESQNVIGRINGANGNAMSQKVIIGAGYDNLHAYAGLHEGYYRVNNLTYPYASGGLSSEAALGGTGVATALALTARLVEYNNNVGLDFNVEIVFFGAEQFGCVGSREYVSSARKNDGMLMVNLSRIGGDNIYAYFDEVDVAHGSLFMDNASKLGFDGQITQPTALHPTAAASSTGGKLPYTNYALMSTAGVFFGGGMKVAAFTTGAWDSFALVDSESMSRENIMGTVSDNVENLARVCPQYATQMAMVADTVFASVTDSRLVDALNESGYDYSWLTYPLAAALTVIVLLIAIAVSLVFITKHLEKKYPYVPPKPTRVKMAVFGMDYENKQDADIFVDTKPSDPFAHEKKPFDPFEDS